MEIEIPSCYTKKEWDKVQKQFYKDYELYNGKVQSFSELINKILENETETTFANKTELSPNMFSRIRNYVSKSDPPQRSTLMSICVGYEIDYPLAQRLFDSLGVGFSFQSKRDYAYIFLLTECRGKSVMECNEILEALGIEEKYRLGSYARRNNKS